MCGDRSKTKGIMIVERTHTSDDFYFKGATFVYTQLPLPWIYDFISNAIICAYLYHTCVFMEKTDLFRTDYVCTARQRALFIFLFFQPSPIFDREEKNYCMSLYWVSGMSFNRNFFTIKPINSAPRFPAVIFRQTNPINLIFFFSPPLIPVHPTGCQWNS